MEISTAPAPAPTALERIDYNEIADWYNFKVPVGGALKREKVYNITLFKHAIARRGLIVNRDFTATNKTTTNEQTGQQETHTYIVKLTSNQMRKD